MADTPDEAEAQFKARYLQVQGRDVTGRSDGHCARFGGEGTPRN
jgi:hypothetical protein